MTHAGPPKVYNLTVRLYLNNTVNAEYKKQFSSTTKVAELLAQVKGGLSPDQKDNDFFVYSDGMKLTNDKSLLMNGVDDGDTVEVKGITRRMSRSRATVPNIAQCDYHDIYLNADKCGFLLKKKITTVSGWKHRWVVLCCGYLYYYLNPKDETPIGKLLINKTNVRFLGSTSEKNFVFSYEYKSVEYLFSCENDEEYQNWRKVLLEDTPCSVSTVAMKMIQGATNFSVVMMNRTKKVWMLLNSGTVFCFESPAESESLFEFYIHETKILIVSSEREITFVHSNARISVRFLTDEDLVEWKDALGTIIQSMGRTLYENSFITDEYKDPSKILRQGFLIKEKLKKMQTRKKRWCILTKNKLFYFNTKPSERDNPRGCFDLLLARVQVAETQKGYPILNITTSEGDYYFSSQVPKDLLEWGNLIQQQCSGMPTNVVHLQHVTFDFEWVTQGNNPNEVFDLKTILGTGSFGTVYHAVHRQSNFDLAIKILTVDKDQSEALKSEIDILKTCRSTNIVSYYGTIKPDENTLWILMDLCAVGSVKDLMKKTLDTLNEKQLRYVLNETLKGLVYLHTIKIIHHDIKAGNILLTNNGVVKLADFGVSKKFMDNVCSKADDFIGSPLFMSPEIIKKSSYNDKTDIWSLGITVIEMADGNPPNTHITNFEQLEEILETKTPSFKNPSIWSPELQRFVAKCLTKEYTDRPSAQELCWDEFLRTSPPDVKDLLELINQSQI